MIDPSLKRVKTVIFPPTVNQVTITADPIAVAGNGPTFTTTTPFLELVGDLARAAINVIANVAGPTPIGFIEYFEYEKGED